MSEFSCEYCKKSFKRENSLFSHSCDKKTRWFRKDTVESRLAFQAWNRFHVLATAHKNPEFYTNFRNFIDSQYYNAFYKFGKHLAENDIIEPGKFIDYVIKMSLPIDKWTSDAVYDQYILNLIKNETSEFAIERSFKQISKWSTDTKNIWTEFFRLVNTNQAVLWIKAGRLSPWLLYNAESAVDFFNRCTPEQLTMIKEWAPISIWKVKFDKNKESCEVIRQTLKETGM